MKREESTAIGSISILRNIMSRGLSLLFVAWFVLATAACSSTGEDPAAHTSEESIGDSVTPIQTTEGVPTLPSIIAENETSISGFSAAAFSETTRDGRVGRIRNFGEFDSIDSAPRNYDSMLDSTLPRIFEELTEIDETGVAVGPFTTKRVETTQDEKNAYYENTDSTVWSALSYSSVGFGYRQFDKVPDGEADYARCHFVMDDPPHIDITEVWEFPDRKEIVVTTYYQEQNNGVVYLGIVEMASGDEKTSMLEGRISDVTDSKQSLIESDYSAGTIGFMNLTMDAVMVSSDVVTDKDNLPDGYPSYPQLMELHNRSKTTIGEAKTELLGASFTDLEPYFGYFQEATSEPAAR